MKTRKFFGIVLCESLSELSDAQRANLVSFETREEQIAQHESRGCDWDENLVAGSAVIGITIKVADVLQHNPNEGVWVYGASCADLKRIKDILGNRVITSRGRRVEGWR